MLAITFESFSQNRVSGKVIDSETKEPIESVYIRNRTRPENSILSDENGLFSIVATLSDTIDLYRIGYKSETFIYKNINNIIITMNPIEYLLDGVTIVNEEADKILQKAISNLKVQYVQNMAYLWHGNMIEKNTMERKESYALFSSAAKKNPLKEKKFLDLWLIHLNHLLNNSKETKILELINIEYFPYSITQLDKYKNNTIIKKESDNDSLIFISCFSKKSKGRPSSSTDIVINKADTVLLIYKTTIPESVNDSTKYLKILFFSGKLIAKTAYLSVKKTGDAYYFDKVDSKFIFSFKNRKKEELIELENTIQAMPEWKITDSKNAKKLDGNSKQLFKLPVTTIDRFWEKYTQ
ncbi:hypothetical protein FACS189426_10660 [Bacteroidia bacterium]|nr:hypothetical protein FACS189426_10660 [Bacteroidia bacterium]